MIVMVYSRFIVIVMVYSRLIVIDSLDTAEQVSSLYTYLRRPERVESQ